MNLIVSQDYFVTGMTWCSPATSTHLSIYKEAVRACELNFGSTAYIDVPPIHPPLKSRYGYILARVIGSSQRPFIDVSYLFRVMYDYRLSLNFMPPPKPTPLLLEQKRGNKDF